MSTALLRAEQLRRRYGERTVVDVDAIEVRPGEILAVLGPNGSGKSTLFRLLLLLERADSGMIHLHGAEVHYGDRQASRALAGVFQRATLFAGNVRGNLEYGLRAQGVAGSERDARVATAAEAFGLGNLMDADVRTLSGGEAQRVALARAITLRPDVLLLDEPTASLDVTMRRSFREDLERAVRVHAGAVVLITHDPAEAFGLADRIAVLDNGRVLQEGTPAELLDDPRSPFVASFTGAELLLDGTVMALAEDLVHVDVGGALIWAVLPPASPWRPERGERVHVAYRPEDVMISAAGSSAEISARNQFRVAVTSLAGSGGLVRLRLDGALRLAALITRTSAESLQLRLGKEVIAQMKATALRVLRAVQ